MDRPESSSVTTSFRGLATLAGRDDDRTVVWLQGEHDISTRFTLADTLARVIAPDEADLVLDLSEVQFISAATVGIIVGARELLRQQSRSLTLRAPSSCARRVLELCSMAGDLGLDTADATPGTPAGALETWVAVPAAERADIAVDASAPNSDNETGRVRARGALEASSANQREPADAAGSLSNVGGP